MQSAAPNKYSANAGTAGAANAAFSRKIIYQPSETPQHRNRHICSPRTVRYFLSLLVASIWQALWLAFHSPQTLPLVVPQDVSPRQGIFTLKRLILLHPTTVPKD